MDSEFTITYMSGALDGKTLHFEQPAAGHDTVLRIGRRDQCEIQLPFDSQASRLHARLVVKVQAVTASESVPDPVLLAFYLEDAQSRNGTFIEHERDPIRGRVSLRPGLLFRIGRTWLRVDEPLPL
jgi:pSer/pThr/pTyr-binding forkhead associated (FHA) protein